MKKEKHCQDCQFCWRDERISDYRRPIYCFCKRRGPFFSRNYKIGEGSRIDPTSAICTHFKDIL